MSRSSLARYLNPWKYKREQQAQRVAALRRRDGDNCTRCRRPMRFDLPPGHDMGVRIEEIVSGAAAGTGALDNFCLTHGRCNAKAGDNTEQVTERVRRKAEAELFDKARRKRRA